MVAIPEEPKFVICGSTDRLGTSKAGKCSKCGKEVFITPGTQAHAGPDAILVCVKCGKDLLTSKDAVFGRIGPLQIKEMLTPRYAILNPDHSVRWTTDVVEWRKAMEKSNRAVARSRVWGCRVMTSFLGLDHNFFGGSTQIFETMVFPPGSWGEQFCARYATWDQALAGHEKAVRLTWKMGLWWACLGLWELLTEGTHKQRMERLRKDLMKLKEKKP